NCWPGCVRCPDRVGSGASLASTYRVGDGPSPSPTRKYLRGAMSRYRRAKIEGGVFFFTVTLADSSSDLLVRHIDHLRQAYKFAQEHYPFETVAICVLPDHLHAVWSLPANDANFPTRWNLIKGKFSRALSVETEPSPSKVAKREKGIWQRRYWEHA